MIPERVWALLTEEEQADLRRMVDGWRHEPRIQCPQCGSHLGVRLRITGNAVRLDDEGGPVQVPAAGQTVSGESSRQASQDVALLQEAQQTGVLAAFLDALREANTGQDKASDPGAVFLHWCRIAKPKAIPRFVVEEARARWGSPVDFPSANGVTAIVAAGVLRQFAPTRLFTGVRMPVLSGGTRMVVSEDTAITWVRGRHGYVPVDTPIFNGAMRTRSIGGFGRLVQ